MIFVTSVTPSTVAPRHESTAGHVLEAGSLPITVPAINREASHLFPKLVSFVPENVILSFLRHTASYNTHLTLACLIRRVHHTDKNFIEVSFNHIHTTYMHAAYGFIRGVRIIRRHSLLASYTLHISFSRCHIITSYNVI